VEAIGTYSNLGHLCKKWTELRKRMDESQARPPLPRRDSPKPRSKRFLTTNDIADIVHLYEAGETTHQVGTRYGISKTRVATILREQGAAIRRLGLPAEDVMEAATMYAAGKSLAWLGARYGVSTRPSRWRSDARASSCGRGQAGSEPRYAMTRSVTAATKRSKSGRHRFQIVEP
jgi:hypothetical protein